MARILITGLSGAGKSTLLAEMARRGHPVVDTDYDGWTQGSGGPWDETRMAALLADHADVVVSGAADNQGRFYDRFDHVVLLRAPIETLIARVKQRVDNPFGRTLEQQQVIAEHKVSVEPLLRRTATHELDGRLPVGDLADQLEAL